MKLMTQEVAQQIPALYSQEHKKDPTVYVKFFTPWSHWTWYVTEFDGKDTFFGFVQGDFDEWGYFSLSELESVTGPFGLRIERELYFRPEPIKKLLGEHFDKF
jgi:hypothetical protein